MNKYEANTNKKFPFHVLKTQSIKSFKVREVLRTCIFTENVKIQNFKCY